MKQTTNISILSFEFLKHCAPSFLSKSRLSRLTRLCIIRCCFLTFVFGSFGIIFGGCFWSWFVLFLSVFRGRVVFLFAFGGCVGRGFISCLAITGSLVSCCFIASTCTVWICVISVVSCFVFSAYLDFASALLFFFFFLLFFVFYYFCNMFVMVRCQSSFKNWVCLRIRWCFFSWTNCITCRIATRFCFISRFFTSFSCRCFITLSFLLFGVIRRGWRRVL